MKEPKNQRFTSFNQLNKRIYLYGVDGGWVFTFIGIIVALSFVLSIIIFRQPLPALGIAVILFIGLFKFLQRYKKRYNKDMLDDPIERDFEVGKLTKVYRDEDHFLN